MFDRRVPTRLKFIEVYICGCGGTGIRKGLKIPRSLYIVDSNSTIRTNGKHRIVGSGRSGKAFRMGSALQKNTKRRKLMGNEMIEAAKARLDKAKTLFDICDGDDSIFEYANAELTAAEKYMEYAVSVCKV